MLLMKLREAEAHDGKQKIIPGLTPDMTEHLLTMAAAALLQPKGNTGRWMSLHRRPAHRWCRTARPHQDRGMLRSKADDLKGHHGYQPPDQHSWTPQPGGSASAYCVLPAPAQDCVKAQIFVYLEDLRQTTEEVCRQNADRSVRDKGVHMATQTLM